MPGSSFPHWLDTLAHHGDLSAENAEAAMGLIIDGQATGAQIGAFLLGLRSKGERPHEIVGLARAMRRRAVALGRDWPDAFDTCGTGGDGAGTLNVSSVVALVLAACGVRVAKHGNRSVSSRCGSADVFEALGVAVDAPPVVVERCLSEAGLGFFFAPTFHPSMRHAGAARRELGVRTAFNLLGPLTNPAHARRQLVGVPRPELTELVATALAQLGSERAWVVHGADGLDEISTSGHTKVSECCDGMVRTFYLHPSDFGVRKSGTGELAGGDAATNAALARNVLAGAPGAHRDVVVINAAAALLVAGRVPSLREGRAHAEHALDSGRGARVLEQLVRVSHEAVPA